MQTERTKKAIEIGSLILDYIEVKGNIEGHCVLEISVACGEISAIGYRGKDSIDKIKKLINGVKKPQFDNYKKYGRTRETSEEEPGSII